MGYTIFRQTQMVYWLTLLGLHCTFCIQNHAGHTVAIPAEALLPALQSKEEDGKLQMGMGQNSVPQ